VLLELDNSLLLRAIQLFAPLLLFLLLGVVELGDDFAGVTAWIMAVGALGNFSLRSLLATVTGEHVLVVTTQSVVVHLFFNESVEGGHCWDSKGEVSGWVKLGFERQNK